MEQLGAEYDKSLSAICGQLIKEALATRGLLNYEVPSADLSPLTERPKTILEKVFPKQPSPSVLKSEVPRETSTSTQEAKDPEWFATPEGLDVLNQRQTQSTDAQMLKLKLMQDLIEQLKSL